MDITFFHKNLSKEEAAFFEDYLSQKQDSISQLLTKFASDAKLLKASIEKFTKHDAYEVELILNLHGKPIVAKEASHNINKAVDDAKDRLVSQIKKHIAHLRKARDVETIRAV